MMTLSSHFRLFCCIVVAFSAPSARAAPDQDTAAALEALRQVDVQLASIGFRLSVAAAPLCDRLEPGVGLQFHTLSQYAEPFRGAIRQHFRFAANLAVEGVVEDSPAAAAGLKADDTIVRVGNLVVPTEVTGPASTAYLATIHTTLAELAPTAPLEVVIERAGVRSTLVVKPVAACRTRYEVNVSRDYEARANGDLVQISSKYFESIDADLLPAVVAHELAHNILRHRVRLSAAGASFGFASGFGKNVGLFRQTEIEADILSVHLLARAGYSPALAARFWREAGEKLTQGQIRSRSHPALADRIATVEAEAAKISGSPAAGLPAFFATRNRALDGQWRQLLVRGSR